MISARNVFRKWTVCQTAHYRKTLRHDMAPRDPAGMAQHKKNAHARTMAPAKQSTTGATFGNIWRPYHETGKTAAPRYNPQSLYLRANSRHHLTLNSRHHLAAHDRLHSAAWQLATFSGASCNDENILWQTILYINSAYMISRVDGRAGQ
jgi:hypothetical protein